MTEYKFRVKDDAGNVFMFPAEVTKEGKKLAFNYDWCPALQAEIKSMSGSHWCGYDKANPRKVWTVDDNAHNKFRIDFLRWKGADKSGEPLVAGTYNPYARYDRPLLPVDCPPRLYRGKLTAAYDHQPQGVSFVVTRRQCILGWDMGVGKTYIMIRVMEWAKDVLGWKDEDFLFVCKGGALFQVILDFKEWDSRAHPRFMSYEGMTALVNKWPSGKPAPKFVVFDESTQIKSPGAQRSVAALHLADSMRAEHGLEAFVVCMTGTPSPKNPADWWHQAEVACPGFLKEGDWSKFRYTLAIIEKAAREDGGSYPKLISWLDDERKCAKCGEFEQAALHSDERINSNNGHQFKKSINQVKRVFERLKGLVDIKFKKDCLSLPKHVQRTIRVKPSTAMLNAAKLVTKAATGAAQALVLMRELSDGFQYKDAPVGTKTCTICAGTGTMIEKFDPLNPEAPASHDAIRAGRLEDRLSSCDACKGAGELDLVERKTVRIACPKDDVLEDLIEEHEDIGRLAVYAGFTGSVDRVVDLFVKHKWHVLRIDGRGWLSISPPGDTPLPVAGKDAYAAFRYETEKYPRTAVVAQASTAGHGLNFDCCPTKIFYSNDFNYENRIQADERNRRGQIAETLKKHGMEHTLTIDLVHLPSDQFVLDNHEKKRKLQALTMGEFKAAMDASIASLEREEIPA